MNVTIIGTGYVGLVSGACLADAGNSIFCLDLDGDKIGLLNRNQIPIYEPGLEPVVKRNREAGRLSFSTDVSASVAHADLRHVLAAARSIGKHMQQYKVIATKSTVPVGTADKVRAVIQEELEKRKADIEFAVVSNPEFLKEGAAVGDFMRPERVIIGSEDARAVALMRQLYAPFQRNHERVMVMGVRSAELTKYAANSMLATRISFMNEIANLAEAIGADIEEVRRGIGSDPRIGYHFLYPGVGYGGSCFPKDVKALQKSASQAGRPLRVLASVDQVNEAQKRVLGDKIRARFGMNLSGRRFGLWGLAFKPNTDDMREAPSVVLIAELIGAGATLRAYDPAAGAEAKRVFAEESRLQIVDSPMATLEGADALAIVTEWQEFRSPDFAAIKAKLKTPAIFDGRNLYDPAVVKSHGLEYYSIGRRI